MANEYKVKAFVPTVKGCGATDDGWGPERCLDFQNFLNVETADGWRLHSSEYRTLTVKKGCGASTGSWLVCVFEKQK
ncbi:MAG: hypothetical protein EOP05_03120 [Proteobacteria bacterium]|nr:MAG: hypothetical protein EOP05_03120 [Pseudomonadota bacterium]